MYSFEYTMRVVGVANTDTSAVALHAVDFDFAQSPTL